MTDPGLNSGPAAVRSSSWLKWLLVASLAVNLLVIGSAAGFKFFGHRGHKPGDRGGEDFGILGYARTLEPDRRAAVRKIVKASRPNFVSLRDDIRKARIDAGNALVTEPFDKEKVRAAMGKIGEAEQRLKAVGISTFLDAAEQLTPAERTGLLEFWKSRRPHHFRERSGPPPPPPGDAGDSGKPD